MTEDFFILSKIHTMKILVLGVFTMLAFRSFTQTDVKLKDQLKATRILENGIELYNIGYSSDAYMNFKQANVLSPHSAKNLYMTLKTFMTLKYT